MYGNLSKSVLCNLGNVECAEQTAEEGDNGVHPARDGACSGYAPT
jgi:hypothetical protein